MSTTKTFYEYVALLHLSILPTHWKFKVVMKTPYITLFHIHFYSVWKKAKFYATSVGIVYRHIQYRRTIDNDLCFVNFSMMQ